MKFNMIKEVYNFLIQLCATEREVALYFDEIPMRYDTMRCDMQCGAMWIIYLYIKNKKNSAAGK